MAYTHNDVRDAALTEISSRATHLYLCSADPLGVYADATITYALASKATPTFGTIGDRPLGGRRMAVNAFDDGTVSATGDATHWALVDSSASAVLRTDALQSSPVALANGQTLHLSAFYINQP